MAPKSRDQLIHCANCGEDYSITYKKCPFCGARNSENRRAEQLQQQQQNQQPQDDQEQDDVKEYVPESQGGGQKSPPPSSSSKDDDYYDDGYVFDGQDVFDGDDGNGGGGVSMSSNKGGKRLVGGTGNGGGNGSSRRRQSNSEGGFHLPEDINWSRVITFACSLIIIVAALVIVFTYVYPRLHDDNPDASNPPASGSSAPSANPSAPPVVTDAPVTPTENVEPPKSFSIDVVDFSLSQPGDTKDLRPVLDPTDWPGTITWTVSDPEYCSVSPEGVVTNLNTEPGNAHRVKITGDAGGITVECFGFMCCPDDYVPPEPTTDPNASGDPGTDTSTPPTTLPEGTIPPGTNAKVKVDSSGLRVRGGPGTTYDVVGSLFNGNDIVVGERSTEDPDWYAITYQGNNGNTHSGFIKGEFITY